MDEQLEALRNRVVSESLQVAREYGQDLENEAVVHGRLVGPWNLCDEAAEARRWALQRRETSE